MVGHEACVTFSPAWDRNENGERAAVTVLVAGAGIGGLSVALTCHQIGVPVKVFESVRTLAPLGVGINLQPNAVRELYELGLESSLPDVGVQTKEWALVGRNGNDIYAEPRGTEAGYQWPQYSVHRGQLQMLLYREALERLGPNVIETDARVISYENTTDGVVVSLQRKDGSTFTETGAVLVGADGLHSQVRAQMQPGEGHPIWGGAIMWRGTAYGRPIRTGASFSLVGSLNQRFVHYPISPPDPDTGLQLQNWIAELTWNPDTGEPLWPLDRQAEGTAAGTGAQGSEAQGPGETRSTSTNTAAVTNDGMLTAVDSEEIRAGSSWNRSVPVDRFIGPFESWCFDWLDVPALIRSADEVFEYPMVDRNPLSTWVDGRVALLGDAAHVMYPVGSNGASQAIVDARVLGACLVGHGTTPEALQAYDAQLASPVGQLVLRNRGAGPIAILGEVDRKCGGDFDDIRDIIPQSELDDFMASYKAAAGFAVDELNQRPPLITPES